jgi:hypothetical protein
MTPAGLAAAVLLVAAPAAAAERIAPSTGPERVAFGIILAGTVLFFAWVAWLARRR